MNTAVAESEDLRLQHRRETLQRELAILESQLAGFQQRNARLPVVVQLLTKALGFGAAGTIEWLQFKLKFKRDELAHFNT